MNESTPRPKERLLRILVCILAILSLLTAFTYMLFEIVKDSNVTKRLLLEAFMESEKAPADTVSQDTTTKPDTADTEAPPYRDLVAVDLSQNAQTIDNATAYVIDEEALLAYTFPKHLFDTRPMILIYHSDPTAAYFPEAESRVPSDYTFQSHSDTVVTVGNALADVLRSAGIASIHLTEPLEDVASVLDTYRATYPSIRYCLDLRRDGIYTTDGQIVKSEGTIDKTPTAQLLLAVGAGCPNWQKNLSGAYQLATLLRQASSTVIRPVLLRPETLGQQSDILHLTLFVGTTGNTVNEATASARFFARYLALFILSNCGVDGSVP